ncbi:hypothetical protein DFJ73DRAFT_766515 [Zopfochytrium polystomum]|nr:hypothetical protein DFJ73DRAFT_766515 [Zopfochytrium polystomum]
MEIRTSQSTTTLTRPLARTANLIPFGTTTEVNFWILTTVAAPTPLTEPAVLPPLQHRDNIPTLPNTRHEDCLGVLQLKAAVVPPLQDRHSSSSRKSTGKNEGASLAIATFGSLVSDMVKTGYKTLRAKSNERPLTPSSEICALGGGRRRRVATCGLPPPTHGKDSAAKKNGAKAAGKNGLKSAAAAASAAHRKISRAAGVKSAKGASKSIMASGAGGAKGRGAGGKRTRSAAAKAKSTKAKSAPKTTTTAKASGKGSGKRTAVAAPKVKGAKTSRVPAVAVTGESRRGSCRQARGTVSEAVWKLRLLPLFTLQWLFPSFRVLLKGLVSRLLSIFFLSFLSLFALSGPVNKVVVCAARAGPLPSSATPVPPLFRPPSSSSLPQLAYVVPPRLPQRPVGRAEKKAPAKRPTAAKQQAPKRPSAAAEVATKRPTAPNRARAPPPPKWPAAKRAIAAPRSVGRRQGRRREVARTETTQKSTHQRWLAARSW